MTTATRAETSWGRFRADLQAEILARTPAHLGRLSWSAEQIESAQRDGLRRLLAHAVAHSPFHRRRLAGTAVADIEPADLASLPVMTKADMMAAIDDVFTDRRLTPRRDRAGAGRHRRRPTGRAAHGHGRRGFGRPRHRRRSRGDDRARHAAPCPAGPRHLAVAADSGPPQHPPGPQPDRLCVGAGPPRG